jgi:hypothetical protein
MITAMTVLSTPVPSTNKTDCHDITEILLKVALNTIILALYCTAVNIRDCLHKPMAIIYIPSIKPYDTCLTSGPRYI